MVNASGREKVAKFIADCSVKYMFLDSSGTMAEQFDYGTLDSRWQVCTF